MAKQKDHKKKDQKKKAAAGTAAAAVSSKGVSSVAKAKAAKTLARRQAAAKVVKGLDAVEKGMKGTMYTIGWILGVFTLLGFFIVFWALAQFIS